MGEVSIERTENTEKEYLIRMWFIENLKDNDGQRWYFEYDKNKIKYYFRDEKDAELFKSIWITDDRS